MIMLGATQFIPLGLVLLGPGGIAGSAILASQFGLSYLIGASP